MPDTEKRARGYYTPELFAAEFRRVEKEMRSAGKIPPNRKLSLYEKRTIARRILGNGMARPEYQDEKQTNQKTRKEH